MPFVKYQHVERFGTSEVADIVSITEPCYVFPKVDGTNASIWVDGGELQFGSRNRHLSLDEDNQGFMEAMSKHEGVKAMLTDNPDLRLYGEWLVPHTIKEYEDSAWRQFYVFDVCYETEDGGFAYMPYDSYKALCDKYDVEYVPCMAIVERGSADQFMKMLDSNTYLMQQGETGEGIVIKRYGFKNRYGRTTWAKIVRNDFKARNQKTMGAAKFAATKMVEEEIAKAYVTQALVDKVHAKIVSENDGEWQSKMIPRLLHTVYYDIVREDCWNFVKQFKNPTINFGDLQKMIFHYTKLAKPELF